jgi:EAL domain-containing protein (putative c-di-GMP-specific phosphodiesterase class I)
VAKERRSGVELYSPTGERDTHRRLMLITDFQHALDEGAATLHYQPCVEVATGRIPSVEALFRWDHPLHGPIAPDELIPMLEQTVHIHRLTRWVLDTALAQCRAWHDEGATLRVAVNLSARDLDDADFPALVTERLRHHGSPAPRWSSRSPTAPSCTTRAPLCAR